MSGHYDDCRERADEELARLREQRAHATQGAHMESTSMNEIIDHQVAEKLRCFEYKHLPEHLQAVSKPFCELAHQVAKTPKTTWTLVDCLQHLMLAKDAAVRSHIS